MRFDSFSNAMLLGGFGHLAGEMDFWSLDTQKEIGKTKSYCAVKIEFAPDGIHLLTAVTFDRVKVDNEVKIFKANGKLVTDLSFRESELYDFIW